MQQKVIALVLCLVAVASATGQQRRDEQPVSRAEIAELWERLSKMQSDVNAMEVEREFLQKINNIANAETTDCIYYIRVQARTGTESGADQNPYYGNSMLAIELTDGSKYSAYISGNKEAGSDVVRDLKVKPSADIFSPDLPSCVTANDIQHVYLEAASGTFTDGWYVDSINTYTAKEDKASFTPLTSDPIFNKWVDYDEQTKYPYNARSIQLSPLSMVSETMVSGDNCITKLKIEAKTGNKYGAGYSDNKHHIQITLEDNINLQGNISSPAKRNEKYTSEMDFATDFNTTTGQCVELSHITGVRLIAGGNDSWYITSIKTYIQVNGTDSPNVSPLYTSLTSDSDFNKWLDDCAESDRYPYDATNIPLAIEDTPQCGYGQPVCECSKYASKCIINLEIDEIRTFTSYQKFPIDEGSGIFVRGTQGVLYYINDDGEVTTHKSYLKRKCANRTFTQGSDTEGCSEPQFVDGETYRMAIGVNALIPGPTIIVHDQQKVAIHVHNNLSTEGISIHWHGMVQHGTPWMDGVGQVTQCQIGPSSSYSYVYTASPTGTFWYHSHSGAQRTDGFFGALIVKERPDRLAQVKTKLSKIQDNLGDFEDLPGEHSITLLDWQLEASLDSFTQLNAGLGFFPDVPLGKVPYPNATRHRSFHSYEKAEIGPVPFFSGIINGKGKHSNVPYAKTRLSVFTVEKSHKYRFRLIGAQGLYAYKFSIDEHKLTVVNTDGYWIQPQTEVDFIIIHTGERYDFILEANNTVKNYWMRAETLAINYEGRGPPYQPLGHVAEAILQYKSKSGDAPVIPSTDYENIKQNSTVVQCNDTNQCKAINCPFEYFHPDYFTDCVNVRNLSLLEPTPSKNLPDAYPPVDCPECLRFINFNFEGDSETSSVNGRNFVLPPVPPQTQNDDFQAQAIQCNLSVDCNPSSLDCMCTHIIDIPYMKTVQFVLSAIGDYDNAHPIHLHGHTFHVVHVAYPSYDPNTGFISSRNQDIECGESCEGKPDGCSKGRCTKPSWKNGQPANFSIDEHTVRKDTVIIPAGGYAVINFISDNPGHWFLHCHIEVHQLEGMALIVNEAFEQQPQAPAELNRCGDFSLSVAEYEQILSAPELRSAAGQGKNSTDQHLQEILRYLAQRNKRS